MLRQRDHAAGEGQHTDRPEQQCGVMLIAHRFLQCNRHAKIDMPNRLLSYPGDEAMNTPPG